jgi:hypothetical protein
MSEQLYWRSGFTDEEGFMRCSCGCRWFTVEQHAERVRVTEAGDPVTVEGRAVSRCGSCEKAVIPLQNFDHLPEAEPPAAEELLDGIVTEGGGG